MGGMEEAGEMGSAALLPPVEAISLSEEACKKPKKAPAATKGNKKQT